MDHLPSIKPKRLIGIFLKIGYVITVQRGSHVKLKSDKADLAVIIPLHTKDLSRGFLKTILKQADISEEDFRKFL